MTFQINSGERIAGIPIITVRDLLRNYTEGGFRKEWLHSEELNEADLDRMLGDLIEREYVSLIAEDPTRPIRDYEPTYRFTDLGHSFVRGSAARRVHRSTVEKLLLEIMQRVQYMNTSDDFLMKVTELVVYGSYLRGEERLGDLDLAYSVDYKHRPASHVEFVKMLDRHFRKSGRTSKGIADLFWPGVQVRLYLRNRKRTVSLHEMHDFMDMPKDEKFSYKVLLGDADSIAQRLKGAEETATAEQS